MSHTNKEENTPPDKQVPLQPVRSTAKPRSMRRILSIIGLVLAVGVAGIGAGKFVRRIYQEPRLVLARAVKASLGASSYQIVLNDGEHVARVIGSIHKDRSKLSQITFNISSSKTRDGSRVEVIFNQNSMYISAKLASGDEIVKSLEPFSQLETFKLLSPVISGEKALHWDLLKQRIISDSGGEDIKKAADNRTRKIYEDLAKEEIPILSDAIIVRHFDQHITYKGSPAKRIAIGFRKDKLVRAVDEIKNHDINASVKQINALKRLVESVDSWDRDIFVVTVVDGTVGEVSLSVPKLSEQALRDSIGEAVNKKRTGNALGVDSFVDRIVAWFKSAEKPNDIIFAGSLEMTDYNNAPVAGAPLNVIDAQEVLEAAQKELLPLFLPIFMNGSGPSPKEPTSAEFL